MMTSGDDILRALFGADWMADALCAEYPRINFFPEVGESTDRAKAVCARCNVNAECLEYAIVNRIEHGIWAGTSARQRKKIRTAGQTV